VQASTIAAASIAVADQAAGLAARVGCAHDPQADGREGGEVLGILDRLAPR